MKNIGKILLGVALIILGVILVAVMRNTEKVVEETAKITPPLVSTSLVQTTSIPFVLEVTGTLEAKNKVEVYSEVQGVLLPIGTPFKVGNTFRKGEYLLQVDNREYKAQLLSNKSNLASQITAMLPDMEIEFPEASKKWESYVRAFTMEGALTPLPKTSTDKEKFFVMGKGILQTYYNVKNQQERILKYKIRAPFNGTVTASNVTAGTLVRSGQKLGEFVNTSMFELELAIPATANRYIRVGTKVHLFTLDEDQEFLGTISRANAKVEQATQTISAIVEVSNTELKDGQFLKAKIEGNPIDDVVKIKGNLLLENDHVYIVRDSILTLQKVLPVNYEKDSVVVKGLKANMILLEEVLANAYPGMPVNF